MSVVVVGSVAYDDVEAPAGSVQDALGGSAMYFASSASFFCPVQMVGVVGSDYDLTRLHYLQERNVDLGGIEIREGKTFRWSGRYLENFVSRETLDTQLNVFETFNPQLPDSYRKTPFLFLANIHPDLQMNVLQQLHNPEYIVLDTMNFWIQGALESLKSVLQKVDTVILNDEEIRELTGVGNLIAAAKAAQKLGPRTIVVKKGEHGAFLLHEEDLFFLPAYPTEDVVDPTGAGDTFAGGFVGYLAQQGTITNAALRRAAVYGTVAASYCVESFSSDRLVNLTIEEINNRYNAFQNLTAF